MIRRCVISKDGKFRVSNPGTSVDSINSYDFMLHEDVLSAQPYFFSKVDCPFASYTGSNAKAENVDVTVPDVDPNPTIILFPISNASLNTFPYPRDDVNGSDQTGYDVEGWDIYAQVLSSTQVRIRFQKDSDGRKSPKGCYMVLVRTS